MEAWGLLNHSLSETAEARGENCSGEKESRVRESAHIGVIATPASVEALCSRNFSVATASKPLRRLEDEPCPIANAHAACTHPQLGCRRPRHSGSPRERAQEQREARSVGQHFIEEKKQMNYNSVCTAIPRRLGARARPGRQRHSDLGSHVGEA